MPLINVKVPNEINEAADKRAAILNKIAALPLDDIDRIGQVVDSPKGLINFKKNWAFIRGFLK